MSNKIAPGFLRFVSMLFLIFGKGDKQKIAPGFLRFVSMLFLIFEKGDKQKIAPSFLRFVSMLFNLIIFLVWKGVIEMFGVCACAFYKNCYF